VHVREAGVAGAGGGGVTDGEERDGPGGDGVQSVAAGDEDGLDGAGECGVVGANPQKRSNYRGKAPLLKVAERSRNKDRKALGGACFRRGGVYAA
jgi:hypothetical protein